MMLYKKRGKLHNCSFFMAKLKTQSFSLMKHPVKNPIQTKSIAFSLPLSFITLQFISSNTLIGCNTLMNIVGFLTVFLLCHSACFLKSDFMLIWPLCSLRMWLECKALV